MDRAKNQLFRLVLNMPKVSRFSLKSKVKAYKLIILLTTLKENIGFHLKKSSSWSFSMRTKRLSHYH